MMKYKILKKILLLWIKRFNCCLKRSKMTHFEMIVNSIRNAALGSYLMGELKECPNCLALSGLLECIAFRIKLFRVYSKYYLTISINILFNCLHFQRLILVAGYSLRIAADYIHIQLRLMSRISLMLQLQMILQQKKQLKKHPAVKMCHKWVQRKAKHPTLTPQPLKV